MQCNFFSPLPPPNSTKFSYILFASIFFFLEIFFFSCVVSTCNFSLSLSLSLFKEALSIFTFRVVYNSLHHQFKTHLYLSCGVYSWQNYHKYCASYQILFGTRRHNLDIRHSYNIIFFFSLSLFSISHFWHVIRHLL